MRKPRDYDSELKAINERAKQLQERKLRQLGEVVAATGADALPIEELAGSLIAALAADDATRGEWRTRGAGFFQRSRKAEGGATPKDAAGESPERSSSAPPDAQESML